MVTERWNKAQDAEKHFWNVQSYEFPSFKADLDVLQKHNIETDNKKILEIGGGATGIVTVIKGERYAIDPLMNYFLENYDMPKDIKHIQGKGEELPYQDKFFDLIFCINTLDHSDEPNKILQETYRCLHDDGIFFMTLNCYDKQIVAVKRFSENIGAGDVCHPYSYTIKDVQEDLKSNGFEIIETTYDPNLYEEIVSSTVNDSKEGFFKKLLRVGKFRGWFYLIKRALVLPLHFIVNRYYKSYPRVYFICRKPKDHQRSWI